MSVEILAMRIFANDKFKPLVYRFDMVADDMFAVTMFAETTFCSTATRKYSVVIICVFRPSEFTFPVTVKRPVRTLVPIPTFDRM